MRRPALLALVCLSLPLLALPSRAGSPAGWSSYDVTLAPLPSPLTGCGAGVEGVHVHSRSVRAPYDGRLDVQMLGLSGDFDIALLDSKGRYVGAGGFGDQTFGPSSVERAFTRVRRGAVVTVRVCNYASPQPQATVMHRLVKDSGRAPAPAPGYRSLTPGSLPDLRERVPVNVVLLGYGSEVDVAELRSGLPRVNRPRERMAAFYGLERPLGITWTYDYRITRTDRAYEDRFFRQLLRLGEDSPPTRFQQDYNDQERNAVTVRDNLRIPAPAVERWLATHPPAGVDTRQHTVFLVSWWGRSDFRFHVYEHASEPTSDVGHREGKEDYAALVAWGGSTADDPETGTGSTRRVWFHDLSAGPDYWTGSWSVDSPDVDGDGFKERRMLPRWEYGRALPRDALTRDLTALVRYVAVDLLFTPSPLYSLRPQRPVLARTMDVDVNVQEMDPTSDGTTAYRPGVLQRSLGSLSPLLRVTSDAQRVPAGDPVHAACLAETTGLDLVGSLALWVSGPGCYPEHRYASWENPFVHGAKTMGTLLDDVGRVDRELLVQSYHLPDQVSSCWAYADDNHRDGTPSMVFGFFPTGCRAGLGTTDILTHEAGHEVGLSHPHDGYDYEQDLDFGAWGDTFFAGVGDEVSSVMSYLFVNNDYSQFDRDNHARFMTAAYLAEVNGIAANVLEVPGKGRAELRSADAAMVRAQHLFGAHRYVAALHAARASYDAVLRAAARSGVRVTASTSSTDLVAREAGIGLPKGRGYSRAMVLDPATRLPMRCLSQECAQTVPRVASDLGGPAHPGAGG